MNSWIFAGLVYDALVQYRELINIIADVCVPFGLLYVIWKGRRLEKICSSLFQIWYNGNR